MEIIVKYPTPEIVDTFRLEGSFLLNHMAVNQLTSAQKDFFIEIAEEDIEIVLKELPIFYYCSKRETLTYVNNTKIYKKYFKDLIEGCDYREIISYPKILKYDELGRKGAVEIVYSQEEDKEINTQRINISRRIWCE